MIGEVEIGGVFLPTILVAGITGFLATLAARRILRVVAAYKFIWHAGLFDVAMFVVMWWLAVLVGARIYGWVGL
jgi:protein AaeX